MSATSIIDASKIVQQMQPFLEKAWYISNGYGKHLIGFLEKDMCYQKEEGACKNAQL